MREPDEKPDRKFHAAERRILQHDRQARRLRDGGEMLDHARLVGLQGRAMIRRHQHQHGGARIGRPLGALGGDVGAEMAGRDDDRNAPGGAVEARVLNRGAFLVGQQELLGEIGEDADAVDALVDHAVDHAPLAFKVERPIGVEHRGRDRQSRPSTPSENV